MVNIDPVDVQIAKGCSGLRMEAQEWEQFDNEIKNKKLVLYGIGDGAISFLYRYGDKYPIYKALDNDPGKKYLMDYDFRWKNSGPASQDLMIERPEALSEMDPQQTVVLILSLKKYSEIAESLNEKGFHSCYSYLCMEANLRRRENRGSYPSPVYEYLKKCDQLPVEDNLVMVYTIGGYCDHGRMVAEELKRRDQSLRFVWVDIGGTHKYPEGIEVVKFHTPDFYKVRATARLWLMESPMPLDAGKKDGQIYIQLKHWGSVTLKVFGILLAKDLERNNADRKDETESWRHNAELTDYTVVGSPFDEQTMRKGFLYPDDARFIMAGSPRSDILFRSDEYRRKIREYYSLRQEMKIALYVPTFRYDNSGVYAYKDVGIDYEQVKAGLESRFGGEWAIILRLHPRIKKRPVFTGKMSFIIDASDYMDSEELVAASDAMIADYSSIMFDAAIMKQPIFLYAPDIGQYTSSERTFLIPYEELPFPKAYSNEDLIRNIACFDENKYTDDVGVFMDRYGVHEDGHASERVAEFILKLME